MDNADAWLASLNLPTTEGERALVRQVWRAATERAAVIAEAEKVDAEDTGHEADEAYNLACDHAAAAIRAG